MVNHQPRHAISEGEGLTISQQLSEDGQVVESTNQEDTEAMIFGENESRFQRAREAPISDTMLINQLGYLADTETAR